MIASPIRNHADWNMRNRVEYFGYYSLPLGTKITYNTYNRLIFIYFYIAKYTYFLYNLFQLTGIIYGKRYGYFRSSNHIYWCFILFKYFKNLPKKTIS